MALPVRRQGQGTGTAGLDGARWLGSRHWRARHGKVALGRGRRAESRAQVEAAVQRGTATVVAVARGRGRRGGTAVALAWEVLARRATAASAARARVRPMVE